MIELIHLKNATVEEFEAISKDFKEMVQVCSFLTKVLFGDDLVVTSIFRRGKGVHSAYRGIDFRVFEKSGLEGTYRIAEIMNSIYQYDYKRPHYQVAITNLYHGTAPHLHLQIHPNTMVLNPDHRREIKKKLLIQQENFKPINLKGE